MDDLLKAIGQVGFPVAVTTYLLVRLERRLAELTIVLNKVAIVCDIIESRSIGSKGVKE